MTVIEDYRAGESSPEADRFDEFTGADGRIRDAWAPLVVGLDDFVGGDLVHAAREVARLLEDDNVTYTPSPSSLRSIADPDTTAGAPLTESQPWRLDPVPLILDDREWAGLEAGIVQRAELLDAILSDLYGARKLLSRGLLPAATVLDHDEYLRVVVGTEAIARQRLFMTAADLGRDVSGQWKVLSDRTQAPSGAGFAMQNRRVISRVLPEVYHQAHLHRLTPFFQAMRVALVDAAPPGVEDPRVVVLSPGTHSETAFDQAFVASLLGFPLLEGRDLTVRDGRVWMRNLGKLEQVDVILRRVDSAWMDALELRGGSRLGVTGLLECVRQGTVSVVNNLGSGVLENPALLPFLPQLCEQLLGSPLRLPSVDTWWCGQADGLDHVLSHLPELIVRPISRVHGRSVVGAALTSDQRERLTAQIRATPHRFVGQEVLQLSSVPTTETDHLVRRSVVLRSFAVRSANSYTAMLGGLARVQEPGGGPVSPLVVTADGGLAKDVWVVSHEPVGVTRVMAQWADAEDRPVAASPTTFAMVPRVLSDLFWFGRYAERAEDLLRLVLAARTVALESDLDVSDGQALETLLRSITHVSTTYPGFTDPATLMMPELRAMLLDRHRPGTVAQCIGKLSMAAQGVRDQLSEDVWIVLADIERALAALEANRDDQGLQLTDASERVLSGLLALAGIVSENMIRDPGWYMLDSGRGLERALQVVALLKVTLGQARAADDRLAIEGVLIASESIVTYRRRYRGLASTSAVVELLVRDAHNPRSVAYQLHRIQTDLRAIPSTSPTARPLRLLDGLTERLRTADPAELGALTEPGAGRPALLDFLAGLQEQLRDLGEAIRDQYQQQPPTQQALWQQPTAGGVT